MTAPPKRGFLDALEALQRVLDDLGAPSMIIGGVAVIALGVPRLTVDIDATVSAAAVSVDHLAEALLKHEIPGRIQEADAFARARHVFLGVHAPSGTPVDVTLAWLPFELEALGASRDLDYAGVQIRVPRPEDLLIYKLIAARPRDIEDAEGLMTLHGSLMDLGRVRRTVKEFADALDDPERPAMLERLIRKTSP